MQLVDMASSINKYTVKVSSILQFTHSFIYLSNSYELDLNIYMWMMPILSLKKADFETSHSFQQ